MSLWLCHLSACKHINWYLGYVQVWFFFPMNLTASLPHKKKAKKKINAASPSLWMDQYCYLTTETKVSTEEPLAVLAHCRQPHGQATFLNSQQTPWSKVLYSISLWHPQELQISTSSDPNILITVHQRHFFGPWLLRWASERWEMKFFTLLAGTTLTATY